MAIFRKQVLKQAIRGVKEKTEIMANPNKYKDTLEDFVDSSDIEPPNMLRPVDKGLRDVMPSSEDPLTKLELDKNISDES